MLNATTLSQTMDRISSVMSEQKQYLIELDQRNGDGDLGISMSDGFAAVSSCLHQNPETDLGKLMIQASKAFNESAPSSLGTILSLGMMGMARTLKGHTEADASLAAEALTAGIDKIMEKAGSKPGEKTILDALIPAAQAMSTNAAQGFPAALTAAAQAAKVGSESTANMPAVHGRAAYYGEKAIGLIDGGSVVGKLIFEAIANA